MKHKIGLMAVVLAAALLVLASSVRQARADDGAWRGFWYGEKYACQVCTQAQMADHNQLALQGTDPGTHVPSNYWNPVPGEPGRLFLCGYRTGASGGDLVVLYPIYYKRSGGTYRAHLDGWVRPGDNAVIPVPSGWVYKAKWYEGSKLGQKCTAGVDVTANICYYFNSAGAVDSRVCDGLKLKDDGYYYCETKVTGWVYGDDPIIVSGEKAAELCKPINPHHGWFETPDEASTPPCTHITVNQNDDGSVEVSCQMHYYNASASVSFCAAVTREPFPRAAVGKPVIFKVDPNQKYEAQSPPIDFCTPDVRGYQLTLIAKADPSREPVWQWNDRNWVHNQTGRGWTVEHTFETSSWGLDLMGPSLTGEWLPAYRVEALVPFRIYVRRTWYDFHGGFHDTGDQPLDLRNFGYPTEDLWVPIYDATTPPPGVPDMHWPQCIVPVPVIEIQGVITGP